MLVSSTKGGKTPRTVMIESYRTLPNSAEHSPATAAIDRTMIASTGRAATLGQPSVSANRPVRQRERRDSREQAASTLHGNQQRQHEQRVMGIEPR